MRLDPGIIHQLEALVADEGFELVATEVIGHGARTILRLVIDGPGGVGLDDCASVSRQASALLDVEDPFTHRYTLEVSSPGLDRKLYSEHDFERFQGQQVKVRMQPGYRQHRVVTGELLGLDGSTLRIRSATGEITELPYTDVLEARLEVDWNAILKEGKSRP